jgi:hypothetical protein
VDDLWLKERILARLQADPPDDLVAVDVRALRLEVAKTGPEHM